MQHRPLLKNLEVLFYFAVYLAFLCNGVVHVYSIRDKIIDIKKFEFAKGWKALGLWRDDSNDELENFKIFLAHNYFWYGIHAVVSEVVRRCSRKHTPLGHAAVGVLFVLCSYKLQTSGLIFLKIATFYVAAESRSRTYSWVLAALWTIVINCIKNMDELTHSLGYQEYFELIIILSWSILRCLSFNLSGVESEGRQHTLVNYLGYAFYFPTMIFGPFMLFNRYLGFLDDQQGTKCRFLNFLKDLTRTLLWLVVADVLLHFLYVSYMEQDINAVLLLPNSFGLYGFGYLMGQFFHLNYTITYGLGIAFAKLDQLKAPAPPRCIGRINFYSDMWKHFDQGLYEFLFKYIYASLCVKSSTAAQKAAAIVATFAFVYIWHGYFVYILIWTVLNLVCLTLERGFKAFFTSKFYLARVAANLSVDNQVRVFALLGTQIFIPSAISNFYFFAGAEIGNHFMSSTYNSGIYHYLSLTMCSYCIFQCCEVINSTNGQVSGWSALYRGKSDGK